MSAGKHPVEEKVGGLARPKLLIYSTGCPAQAPLGRVFVRRRRGNCTAPVEPPAIRVLG